LSEDDHERKHNSPEFLRKLVEILSDATNFSIIEWKESRIHVYDPEALCSTVLPRYFRHTKYSSFQRQLNYFGFKKTEGKGKMTPCVYSCVDLYGKNLQCILEMKRKVNATDQKNVLKLIKGSVKEVRSPRGSMFESYSPRGFVVEGRSPRFQFHRDNVRSEHYSPPDVVPPPLCIPTLLPVAERGNTFPTVRTACNDTPNAPYLFQSSANGFFCNDQTDDIKKLPFLVPLLCTRCLPEPERREQSAPEMFFEVTPFFFDTPKEKPHVKTELNCSLSEGSDILSALIDDWMKSDTDFKVDFDSPQSSNGDFFEVDWQFGLNDAEDAESMEDMALSYF